MEEERPKVKKKTKGLFGQSGGKVEGQKMIGGQKKFLFPLFLFSWEWKSRGMEKVSLNKFTHIPLIKNDAQKVTTKKKKGNH